MEFQNRALQSRLLITKEQLQKAESAKEKLEEFNSKVRATIQFLVSTILQAMVIMNNGFFHFQIENFDINSKLKECENFMQEIWLRENDEKVNLSLGEISATVKQYIEKINLYLEKNDLKSVPNQKFTNYHIDSSLIEKRSLLEDKLSKIESELIELKEETEILREENKTLKHKINTSINFTTIPKIDMTLFDGTENNELLNFMICTKCEKSLNTIQLEEPKVIELSSAQLPLPNISAGMGEMVENLQNSEKKISRLIEFKVQLENEISEIKSIILKRKDDYLSSKTLELFIDNAKEMLTCLYTRKEKEQEINKKLKRDFDENFNNLKIFEKNVMTKLSEVGELLDKVKAFVEFNDNKKEVKCSNCQYFEKLISKHIEEKNSLEDEVKNLSSTNSAFLLEIQSQNQKIAKFEQLNAEIAKTENAQKNSSNELICNYNLNFHSSIPNVSSNDNSQVAKQIKNLENEIQTINKVMLNRQRTK